MIYYQWCFASTLFLLVPLSIVLAQHEPSRLKKVCLWILACIALYAGISILVDPPSFLSLSPEFPVVLLTGSLPIFTLYLLLRELFWYHKPTS